MTLIVSAIAQPMKIVSVAASAAAMRFNLGINFS
jgi:hypothetical protein